MKKNKKNKKAFFRKQEIKIRKKERKSKKNSNNLIEIQKVVGTFQKSKNYGFVVPDGRKLKTDIYIQKKNCNNATNGQKVLVEILKPEGNGKSAEGRIVKNIGNSNESGIDVLSIIYEQDLPYKFPENVISEAEKISNTINKAEIKDRVDLRKDEVFTIDGEDAKDLDDAVSVKENEDGTYILNVHIADVSHYVKEKSAIDKEAIKRGTSVYFPDRVIPMLPKKLSNGICSLNEGEDRFTLSCSMVIDKKGYVISSKVYKAIINVTKRMNYTDVHKIINKLDNEVLNKYREYVPHFMRMYKLYTILEKRRIKDGYLDLDIPESKIILNEENVAVDVMKYEITEANRIIEQFMLTANETIAEKFETLKAPFIYRNHEVPDEEKVEELNKFLFNLNCKIEINNGKITPKSVQKVLNEVKNTFEEKAISNLVLRTLKQAKYENENNGHFGIASKCYCHFTSPIRRYPDLFIHRVISEYLDENYQIEEKRKRKLLKKSKFLAEKSSERERVAIQAERDAEDVKKAEYMESKIGEEYEAIISSVTSFGIFAELENTVEGFIRFENLGNDYYEYNEEKRQLVGEKTREVLKVGDRINIRVIEASKVQRRVWFERIYK